MFVTSAPNDPATLYVVEKRGVVELARAGKHAGVFLDIRSKVLDDGERGLLGLAFSPRYAQNHLFYVDYSDLDGNTRVVELSSTDPTHERELLHVEQPFPNHKGGMLAFDKRGRLYVGLGDGGTDPQAQYGDEAGRAQNMNVMLGKILRLDPVEVAVLGVRNPWRFSFDRLTGDLWVADLGTDLYEELDFRSAAQLSTLWNFGWDRFEGTIVYNPNMPLSAGTLVRPLYEYRYGIDGACGIIGGYVYRGSRVPAARGRYFFGDLCTGLVSSLRRDAKGRAADVRQNAGSTHELTSFGENAKGELFAVGLSGRLYQLLPR